MRREGGSAGFFFAGAPAPAAGALLGVALAPALAVALRLVVGVEGLEADACRPAAVLGVDWSGGGLGGGIVVRLVREEREVSRGAHDIPG